jgi:Fic family protein
MTIRYGMPQDWIRYESAAVLEELLGAKAAILALTRIPFQKSWAEDLQRIQLKREVAGTSRIEGAEFTEKELDAAMIETPEQLATRSQRQAAAAVAAYRWIAALPMDRPIDQGLVLDIHRHLVSGCDDDHCSPGTLRGKDQNVTFGAPRHRGAEGGDECATAFRRLAEAARTFFTAHAPLVQAIALHYHLAAMHPFSDGNGRTARALEALMLQRVGLRDTLFIAMSNYYYDNKTAYLEALNETGAMKHDLTPFLKFALKGVERQCGLLFEEIRLNVTKALFRNTATDLFGRLRSPRKRVMSARHVQLLNALLEEGEAPLSHVDQRTRHLYLVKNPYKALVRDLNYLVRLQALRARRAPDSSDWLLSVNLEWPAQITDSEFFKLAKDLPKAKVHGFLSS